MLRLKKIAVTGGLACGKTSVCRFFQDLGAYVLSADDIVHKVLSSDAQVNRQVVDLLGTETFVNGKLNRERIADKVFSLPNALQSLEKILHPKVYREIEEKYQIINKEENASLFVAEVPLLFETGGEKYFDKTVAVISDATYCKERYVHHINKSREEYEKRMSNQLPQEVKVEKADFIIVNNKSLNELKPQVKIVFKEISKE